MHCRRAATILAAREHGPIGIEIAAALERHLETCAGCTERAESETRLTEALASLHVDLPFEIDVTARVIAGLPERAPDRDEVSARQLGWAAAVAVAGASAVAGLFWFLAPELWLLARDGWAVASGLQAAIVRTATAMESLATLPLELGGRLLRFLYEFLPTADLVRPAAVSVIALLAAAMAATIFFVVGRDLKRPAWQQEQP